MEVQELLVQVALQERQVAQGPLGLQDYQETTEVAEVLEVAVKLDLLGPLGLLAQAGLGVRLERQEVQALQVAQVVLDRQELRVALELLVQAEALLHLDHQVLVAPLVLQELADHLEAREVLEVADQLEVPGLQELRVALVLLAALDQQGQVAQVGLLEVRAHLEQVWLLMGLLAILSNSHQPTPLLVLLPLLPKMEQGFMLGALTPNTLCRLMGLLPLQQNLLG
jgi:hypothetical protein